MKVYYGWCRINKIRVIEGISVIYENDSYGAIVRKQSFLSKMQDTVFVRNQTKDEEKDAKHSNRAFTEYRILMNSKHIKNSLNEALNQNFKADENNVSEKVRVEIKNKLRDFFLIKHRGYKEPRNQQLELNLFE